MCNEAREAHKKIEEEKNKYEVEVKLSNEEITNAMRKEVCLLLRIKIADKSTSTKKKPCHILLGN